MSETILMSEMLDTNIENATFEFNQNAVIPVKSLIMLAEATVKACTYETQEGLKRVDKRALYFTAPVAFIQVYYSNLKVDVEYDVAYDLIVNTNLDDFTKTQTYKTYKDFVELTVQMVEAENKLEFVVAKGFSDILDMLINIVDSLKDNIGEETLGVYLSEMVKKIANFKHE